MMTAVSRHPLLCKGVDHADDEDLLIDRIGVCGMAILIRSNRARWKFVAVTFSRVKCSQWILLAADERLVKTNVVTVEAV
jgi:hypothetical protein